MIQSDMVLCFVSFRYPKLHSPTEKPSSFRFTLHTTLHIIHNTFESSTERFFSFVYVCLYTLQPTIVSDLFRLHSNFLLVLFRFTDVQSLLLLLLSCDLRGDFCRRTIFHCHHSLQHCTTSGNERWKINMEKMWIRKRGNGRNLFRFQSLHSMFMQSEPNCSAIFTLNNRFNCQRNNNNNNYSYYLWLRKYHMHQLVVHSHTINMNGASTFYHKNDVRYAISHSNGEWFFLLFFLFRRFSFEFYTSEPEFFLSLQQSCGACADASLVLIRRIIRMKNESFFRLFFLFWSRTLSR